MRRVGFFMSCRSLLDVSGPIGAECRANGPTTAVATSIWGESCELTRVVRAHNCCNARSFLLNVTYHSAEQEKVKPLKRGLPSSRRERSVSPAVDFAAPDGPL